MSKDELFRRLKSDPVFWAIYILLAIMFLKSGMAIGWDDSEYLAFGKSLFSDFGYSTWYRPPVWPLILGVLWRIGLPMPATMTVLATTIYLSLPLIPRLAFDDNRRYAGLLFAAHPFVFMWSHLSLSHIIASAFILLSFSTGGLASGALSAMAGLSRFTYFIYLPFSLLRPDRWARLKGQLAVLIPYFTFTTWKFRNPLFQFDYASFVINKQEFLWFWTKDPFFYFKWLLVISPIALLALRRKNHASMAFLASFAYFQLLPHKEERFLIDSFVYLAIALTGLGRRASMAQLAYFLILIPLVPRIHSIPAETFEGIEDGTVLGMTPEVNAYKDVEFRGWFSARHEMRWDSDYCIFSKNAIPCSDHFCESRINEFRQTCLSWDVLSETDSLIVARNPTLHPSAEPV